MATKAKYKVAEPYTYTAENGSTVTENYTQYYLETSGQQIKEGILTTVNQLESQTTEGTIPDSYLVKELAAKKSKILTGTSAPSSSTGTSGSYYFETTSQDSDIFYKPGDTVTLKIFNVGHISTNKTEFYLRATLGKFVRRDVTSYTVNKTGTSITVYENGNTIYNASGTSLPTIIQGTLSGVRSNRLINFTIQTSNSITATGVSNNYPVGVNGTVSITFH